MNNITILPETDSWDFIEINSFISLQCLHYFQSSDLHVIQQNIGGFSCTCHYYLEKLGNWSIPVYAAKCIVVPLA